MGGSFGRSVRGGHLASCGRDVGGRHVLNTTTQHPKHKSHLPGPLFIMTVRLLNMYTYQGPIHFLAELASRKGPILDTKLYPFGYPNTLCMKNT